MFLECFYSSVFMLFHDCFFFVIKKFKNYKKICTLAICNLLKYVETLVYLHFVILLKRFVCFWTFNTDKHHTSHTCFFYSWEIKKKRWRCDKTIKTINKTDKTSVRKRCNFAIQEKTNTIFAGKLNHLSLFY